MLRTTFLLVFVSRVFCHHNQSAANRKSQQRMLSKQDTGVWKVKEEEANNYRKTPKQNAQVCLGHEIKKFCNRYTCNLKCWIQLKDDDDLDRRSMLRKLSLKNKTDSPIDRLFKLSATWSDFKIFYSTWLWWLSIAAYTPPPLPPPSRDFVRFP